MTTSHDARAATPPLTCRQCDGPIGRTKKTITSSTSEVATIVFRRAAPSQWRKGTVPATFKEYARLYDILFHMDSEREPFRFSRRDTDLGADPAEIALKMDPAVKPKRCVYAGSAPIPMRANEVMVFALPVDTDEETSADGCVVAEREEHRWVPLQTALHSIRNLRDYGPKLRLADDTKRILTVFTTWLSDRHQYVNLVAALWKPHARLSEKASVTNHFARLATPEESQFRQAPFAVVNPMFKSTMLLPTGDHTPKTSILTHIDEAFAVSSAYSELLQRYEVPEDASSFVSWDDEYPLHAASMRGDAAIVRSLLKKQDPKGQDLNGWTPLHFACWHGNEEIVRILMDDWKGGPSLQTNHGATPLHFAARNGHAEVVRLLVTCPIVDIHTVDENGETAAGLCRKEERNEWQDVLAILTNPDKYMHAVNRFSKLSNTADVTLHDCTIRFLDKTAKRIRLPSAEVSALDVRNATAAMIQMPEDLYSLFSVWIIISESYQLEVEMNHNPLKMIEGLTQELSQSSQQGGDLDVSLFFKRASSVQLYQERRVVSQVALKVLFDEALHNVLTSLWPTSLDDAVHLAGLLMQIRFGDFNGRVHKTGFLRGALDTFVPQHLLHNQLKTAEWESRIFAAHQKLQGNTDIRSLHRLYLQFCWQWPYYGSTLFDCDLLRPKRKKPEPIRIAVNVDWLCIITQETNALKTALSWDEVKTHARDDGTIRVELLTSDPAKVASMQPYALPQHQQMFDLVSPHSEAIQGLIERTLEQISQRAKEMEERRMAQGGPRELKLVSAEPSPNFALSKKEREAYLEKQQKEKLMRLDIIQSFGQVSAKKSEKTLAEQVFDKYCKKNGQRANVVDLKSLCYECGYWLGSELDGARMSLNCDGTGTFSFRDFVSWWSQSKRAFLFLLDDAAFRERQSCVDIFLRNDPKKTGIVSDEKFQGLVHGLRSSDMTRKTEEAIRKGLDPRGNAYLTFNAYIDWLSHMNIIADKVLDSSL